MRILTYSLRAKVVGACSPLWPTLPLARTARHSPESPMCRVWVANALSTAVCLDTCSLWTARVASAAGTTFQSLDLIMLRTCLRGFMDSNTFPLGNTEFLLFRTIFGQRPSFIVYIATPYVTLWTLSKRLCCLFITCALECCHRTSRNLPTQCQAVEPSDNRRS